MTNYKNLGEAVYFWFAANDTSGSGNDGSGAVSDVREAGATISNAPIESPTPGLLSNASYPPGAYEIEVLNDHDSGYEHGKTYAVFSTLAVDGQNPVGFVGSWTNLPLSQTASNVNPFVNIPAILDLSTVTTKLFINFLGELLRAEYIFPGTYQISAKNRGSGSYSSIVSTANIPNRENNLIWFEEAFSTGAGYVLGDTVRITLQNIAAFIRKNTVIVDNFESNNFNAWSSTTGSPTINSTTPISGTYDMRANTVDQSYNAAVYEYSTNTPRLAEYSRFQIDASNFVDNGANSIRIFDSVDQDSGDNSGSVFVSIITNGSLQLVHYNDSNSSSANNGSTDIVSAGIVTIELLRVYATSPYASDAYSILLVDGEMECNLNNINNFSRTNRIRYGFLFCNAVGSTGHLFLDNIEYLMGDDIVVANDSEGLVIESYIINDLDGDDIADNVLGRDFSSVSSPASRSLLNATRALRNRVAISGGTITVYQEDDTTTAWTGSVTTAASNPVTEIDPT